MRLIDADALYETLCHLWDRTDSEDFEKGVFKLIAEAPTVGERKKGKWIHHPEIGYGETWLCSECGEKTVSSIMGEPRYVFCPMCGADMRGES